MGHRTGKPVDGTALPEQPDYDPIRVEVWRQLLASAAEEMGAALQRTAYSPNIKERLDHSCALFLADGRLLAQAAHIPVHLGAMPEMMRALLKAVHWKPGMMVLCNDPEFGGTHLPDLTLAAPVYIGGELTAFVANRAHHADIGGISPGSMPLSREICQEGLLIPPTLLVEGGRLRSDILRLVCANSRTPRERQGDLAAQVAANEVGMRRIQDLASRFGTETFLNSAEETLHAAEQAVRSLFLHHHTAEAEDFLESDGFSDRPLCIRVRVTCGDGSVHFDFTGTSGPSLGSMNAPRAVTCSACAYAVRCLLLQEIPMNAGAIRPISITIPENSLLDAKAPRAVAAGNVETSQRVTDVVFAALAQIFPDRMPAAGQGTMNNLTIGSTIGGRVFAYYETMGGGHGASPVGDGMHAAHVHMSNTRNTPVEVLERHYPLRVKRYAVRRGSGGSGLHRGGDGLVREVELLCDAEVTLIAERHTHGPNGLLGGESGRPGALFVSLPNRKAVRMPSKFNARLPAGTLIRVETPGGGGWQKKDRTEGEFGAAASL
jgi:N-methylhydantoinase B